MAKWHWWVRRHHHAPSCTVLSFVFSVIYNNKKKTNNTKGWVIASFPSSHVQLYHVSESSSELWQTISMTTHKVLSNTIQLVCNVACHNLWLTSKQRPSLGEMWWCSWGQIVSTFIFFIIQALELWKSNHIYEPMWQLDSQRITIESWCSWQCNHIASSVTLLILNRSYDNAMWLDMTGWNR